MIKKVLIVEDDADFRQLLEFNLRRAGLCVASASDGIDGLKRARTLAPDVIVLDLMLPQMDGWSVCETLRSIAATASVPVLVITALSGELARLTSLDYGATDYLAKPFSMKTLVGKVTSLLSSENANRAEGCCQNSGGRVART